MSRLKKVLIGLGVLALLFVAGNLFYVWRIGAWGLLFPSDAYETTPPEIADDFGRGAALRVLAYSKTNSFRHREAIPAARALFDAIAARRGWAVFHTENSAVFAPELLAHFDGVVFSNPSGNHASDAQDAALRAWLEGGGGWVGIHSAGDASHEGWPWYTETFLPGRYIGHILGPQIQEARVVVEDRAHPVTRGLPPEFRHEEEWYSWERGAREAGFRVLLTVDESSYSPWIRGLGEERDISMGDHPIAWTRCVGRGRAAYTAMGHQGAAYRQPHFTKLLENAIGWAGGLTGTRCADAPPAPR